jgi:peptidoglycan hydrolase CwlO-like protein
MKFNKAVLLFGFFFLTHYAVTIDDVHMLNIKTFFTEWSRFLDQVLQAKEEPLSQENEAIYKSFIDQAEKLNIPKVTGDTESITAMQDQIDLIKKRIADEKNLFNEWDQFGQMLLEMKEFPLSAEMEDAYQGYIKRAKDLHIEQSRIDEMDAKMNEIREKLLAESVKNEPDRQAARLEELEKKVEELSKNVPEQGENI